jgi:hypothetical protein
VSRTLTAPLVDAFRQRFPRATLSVIEGLSTYTLEWLAQGRIDCAVVYNATPAAAVDLLPVLQEPLFLVSARRAATGPKADAHANAHAEAKSQVQRGPALSLAQLATRELVIPSRPHAIRMKLETVLAQAGLKPRVALEIESVPAILDLVQRHALHAVLSLNAVRASGREGHGDLSPNAAGCARDERRHAVARRRDARHSSQAGSTISVAAMLAVRPSASRIPMLDVPTCAENARLPKLATVPLSESSESPSESEPDESRLLRRLGTYIPTDFAPCGTTTGKHTNTQAHEHTNTQQHEYTHTNTRALKHARRAHHGT